MKKFKKNSFLKLALTLGLALGTVWHASSTCSAAEVIVDQTYNPASTNAVSSKAMSGVINNITDTIGGMTGALEGMSGAIGDMDQLKYMPNVSRGNLADVPMAIPGMGMDLDMDFDYPGVGDAPHVASTDSLVNAIGNLDSSIGDQALFQQMNYIKEATSLVTAFGYLDQQVNTNEKAIGNLSKLEEMPNVNLVAWMANIPMAMTMPDDGVMDMPNHGSETFDNLVDAIGNLDIAIGGQYNYQGMNYVKEATNVVDAIGRLDEQIYKNAMFIGSFSQAAETVQSAATITAAVGDLSKLGNLANVNMNIGRSEPMLMAADEGSDQNSGVNNIVDAIVGLDAAIGNPVKYQGMKYAQGATSVVDAIGSLDKQIYKNEENIKTNAEAIGALQTEVDSKASKEELKNVENDLNKRIDEIESGDIAPLKNKVDTLGDRINKVGANAAALAALHPMSVDDGDKLSVAVGGGTYRDKYASALGLFYRPSDRVMVSLAGSVGSGESMANVGLSFALDRNVNGMPSRKALNAEVKELKAQNAAQAEQIAMLIKRIEALEAKN